MALNTKTKLGITLAIAVLAGLTSVWIAVLLLVLAALLIAWGQVSERTEAFVGRLPSGNYLLKALARIDLILWPPDLRKKDLAQEDLQEDLAQKDEGNLVQEEYFRTILRGYSPLARRITGGPKYVLDDERVQYFQDGLVETTHSGQITGRISGYALAAAPSFR